MVEIVTLLTIAVLLGTWLGGRKVWAWWDGRTSRRRSNDLAPVIRLDAAQKAAENDRRANGQRVRKSRRERREAS